MRKKQRWRQRKSRHQVLSNRQNFKDILTAYQKIQTQKNKLKTRKVNILEKHRYTSINRLQLENQKERSKYVTPKMKRKANRKARMLYNYAKKNYTFETINVSFLLDCV